MSASARQRAAAHGDAYLAGARRYDANSMHPSLLYAQTMRRPYPSLLEQTKGSWVGPHIEARIAQLGPAERSGPVDSCRRRLCTLRGPSVAQAGGKRSGGSRKVPHASCQIGGCEVGSFRTEGSHARNGGCTVGSIRRRMQSRHWPASASSLNLPHSCAPTVVCAAAWAVPRAGAWRGKAPSGSAEDVERLRCRHGHGAVQHEPKRAFVFITSADGRGSQRDDRP